MPVMLVDPSGLAAPALVQKFPTVPGYWYECSSCGRHVEGLSDLRNSCQECLAPVHCRWMATSFENARQQALEASRQRQSPSTLREIGDNEPDPDWDMGDMWGGGLHGLIMKRREGCTELQYMSDMEPSALLAFLKDAVHALEHGRHIPSPTTEVAADVDAPAAQS